MPRFPRKREWAALVALARRGGELSLGEAIDILRVDLCVTKRTARRIIKRLSRIGALSLEKSDGEITVKSVEPSVFLERLVDAYMAGRKRRCTLRGRGESE
ncbi:MAG: hypothetical protein GSR80_001640 [Desulfurococcales archaeon]|nr:hypothetical protein [Desulfurococcales archaeon]